ncbi:MAG: hypothetical protein LQ352_006636, partial [Teloschistes flavicans]
MTSPIIKWWSKLADDRRAAARKRNHGNIAANADSGHATSSADNWMTRWISHSGNKFLTVHQKMYIKVHLLPRHYISSNQQSAASSIPQLQADPSLFQTPQFIPLSSVQQKSPTINMQFKSIVAFVSLAAMAVALPAENLLERTTPGQTEQNMCKQGQKAKCCDSVTKTLVGLVPINLGLNCVDLDLISVLPIGSQCSQSQQLACCNTGSQTGVVNVGSVCPIL